MPSQRATRVLFQRIDRCCSDTIASSGEADLERIADLIETALEDPKQRRTVLVGIAGYVASCIGGIVPDL